MFSICHPIIVQCLRERGDWIWFVEVLESERKLLRIKRLLWERENSASMVTFSRLPRAQAIGLSAINFYFLSLSLTHRRCWLFFMKFPLNEGFEGNFLFVIFYNQCYLLFTQRRERKNVSKMRHLGALLIAKSIHESHLMS